MSPLTPNAIPSQTHPLVPTQEHTKDRNDINWRSRQYLRDSGIWQRVVNDKLAASVYARSLAVRHPAVLFCGAVGDTGRLKDFKPPGGTGFVVKDLHGDSSKGV